jgi:ribose transport system substrate-binding protein
MKAFRSIPFMILVIASLLVACVGGQGATVVPTSPPVATVAAAKTAMELQGGKPFRFVHPNRQHPVVRLMMLGFFEACKDLKVSCVDQGQDLVDIPGIVAKGEEAISLGSSGIVFTQDKVWYAVGEEEVKAGIPLVATHVQLKNNEIPGLYAWVAADNADYSTRSADKMAELIACKGTVSITQGSYNDVENVVSDVFTKELLLKCPTVVVLKPEVEGFDPQPAIAKMVSIFQANPGITAAFSTTGAGPSNWAEAAKEMNYEAGKVKIAGMDYSRQNLDLVKSGYVAFLVGQPLYEEHYKAVECLVALLQKNPCKQDQLFPAPLVDQSNMNTYYGFNDRADAMVIP